MVSPLSHKYLGKVALAKVHGKKVILISNALFAVVFDGQNIYVETSQLYKGNIKINLFFYVMCPHFTGKIIIYKIQIIYLVFLKKNIYFQENLVEYVETQINKSRMNLLDLTNVFTPLPKSSPLHTGKKLALKK